MRHYVKLLRATLTALLMLVATAGAAVADQFKDAGAAFQRGDYATALRLFRALAQEGDAAAQTVLGLMYDEGQGVPRDYTEAAKRFRKAADQGDADARSTSVSCMPTAQACDRTTPRQ